MLGIYSKITHCKTRSRTMWSLPDSDGYHWIKRAWILDRIWTFRALGWFSPAVLVAAVWWDRRTFERSKCWILKSTTSGQVDSLRIVAIHHIRPKWVVDLLQSNAGPTGTGSVFAHRMVTSKTCTCKHWKILEVLVELFASLFASSCFFYIAPAKDKLYTRMVVGVALITALFLQLQKHQAWPASLWKLIKDDQGLSSSACDCVLPCCEMLWNTWNGVK